MRQFIEIRTEVAKQHPNILLLYRMGDFYETFFEDAVEINRLLGITLTSRGKGKPDAIPMAGVPFMTLDSYLARLVKLGKSVGIVEQIGDPAAVKGTMPRKLVRIVTPGTITEDELLPAKADAALIAVCPPSGKKSPQWSVVSLVLSSGAFKGFCCTEDELPGEIARISPQEILIPDSCRETAKSFSGAAQLTPLPDWHFDPKHGTDELLHHFNMENLDAWAVSEKPGVLAAAGAILGYVEQTQVDAVPHIRPLVFEESSRFVGLDPSSRRNLELTEPLRSENGPTLFSTIDHCHTSMGSRMLRSWITQPLRDPTVPRARHEAVREMIENESLRDALSEPLKNLPDLERVASRIALGSVRPRELSGLRDALPALQRLSEAAALSRVPLISDTAATLDALLSFAKHAADMEWTCPELSDAPGLMIEGARHPVVEKALEHYVANDCSLEPGRRLLVITGPNMGGKSTYMRSVALIVILALAGSWVPAKHARIGSIDRILTRIGASDDLARGLSTFMVEMVEAAAILHQATDRSLVLMDEIGRGTSTFDGLSLAGAIARELADRIRCYTLFATHYFELTMLAQTCAEVANVHVKAVQSGGKVVFLHEVTEGPASQSYGIAVAQLAGVPQHVIREAKAMLRELEKRAEENGPEPDLFSSPAASLPEPEIELEEERESPEVEKALSIRDDLLAIDPDTLTPREALASLYELIQKAKKKD